VCSRAIPVLCCVHCSRREEGFIGWLKGFRGRLDWWWSISVGVLVLVGTFSIICTSDLDGLFPARSARRDYEAYDDDDDEAAAAAATVVRRSPAKYLSR
jgi:hypothetical protein